MASEAEPKLKYGAKMGTHEGLSAAEKGTQNANVSSLGSGQNPPRGTEEKSQSPASGTEERSQNVNCSDGSEGQLMGETSSKRLSRERDSSTQSQMFDDLLVKMGISESRVAATRLRDDVFFAVASPFGLVGKEYQVDWEATSAHLHLRQRGNKIFCCCALLFWAALLACIAFNIYIVVSPDLRVRSVMQKAWKSGAATIPDIFVTSRDDIKMMAESCLIIDGDYGAYKSNSKAGRLDPQAGGCEYSKLEDVSDRQDVDANDGGCKFKDLTLGTQQVCWRLKPSRVVGEFGSPAYQFTRLTLMKEVPVGYSSLKEQAAFNVIEKNEIINIRGEMENAFRVHYYTSLVDRKPNIEMYFRKRTLTRYGYDGVQLHAENLDAINQDDDAEENDANVFQWTTFDYQYQRTSEVEMLDTDQNQTHVLVVCEVFLRASPFQDIYEERPKLTFLELPSVVGGFFTGFVALGVCLLKSCRDGIRKGFRRSERPAADKTGPDEKEEVSTAI